MENATTLNEERKSLVQHNNHIILCSRPLSVGFDLKLGMPACVVVVANGNRITGSEVVQMFGRASRIQGGGRKVILI